MTEKNKNQPKPTTAAEAPKRRTRSRKTALTLRQELLTELERMALGDQEAPRDKLKAMELLARLTEKGEENINKPIVVRVELTDDDPDEE